MAKGTLLIHHRIDGCAWDTVTEYSSTLQGGIAEHTHNRQFAMQSNNCSGCLQAVSNRDQQQMV